MPIITTVDIAKRNFGWSKAVFDRLDFDKVTLQLNGVLKKITACSTDSSSKNHFKVVITTKMFAIKIRIYEPNTSKNNITHPWVIDPIVDKFYRNINTFTEFVDALVTAYCAANGCVRDSRMRIMISKECMKDLERSGYPIGT